MNSSVLFRKKLLPALLMTILFSFFLIKGVNAETNNQVNITLDGMICSSEVEIDLAEQSTLQFAYKLSPATIVQTKVNWELILPEDHPNCAKIDKNGKLTLTEDAVDEPISLQVSVNNIKSQTVTIIVSDSNNEIQSISARFSPIFVSSNTQTLNLLNCLNIFPANIKVNPNQLVFSSTDSSFTINNGILNLSRRKSDSTTVFVKSVADDSIATTLFIEVKEQELITGISVKDNLELTTLSSSDNVSVMLVPSNATDGVNVVFEYESANPEIATVDIYGNVFPEGIGETDITVTATINSTKRFTAVTHVTVVNAVALESFTVENSIVNLSTVSGGQRQEQLRVKFVPSNTTQTKLKYTSLAPSVAMVSETGLINANAEGKTTITVTDELGNQRFVIVNVSNNPIVADYVSVYAANADEFTVIAKNVRTNPALNTISTPIVRATCFAFSDLENHSDINAKRMFQTNGNDWSITLPVNGNAINNYFDSANNIRIHVYASADNASDGSIISSIEYNYVNYGTSPTNITVTPYVQNKGFITPSAKQEGTAGTVGENLGLEGIRMSSPINDLTLNYSVYVQGKGWEPYSTSGQFAGTMHQNNQIEGIKIYLSGKNSTFYRVEYRAHIQDTGWSNWVENDQVSGLVGSGKKIEAVQIRIVQR